MWDLLPDLSDVLREKAATGCRIRFILGIPADRLVEADEATTAAPLKLSTWIEQTRFVLEPLRDAIGVRESALGYGRSVFRGDNKALLNI